MEQLTKKQKRNNKKAAKRLRNVVKALKAVPKHLRPFSSCHKETEVFYKVMAAAFLK